MGSFYSYFTVFILSYKDEVNTNAAKNAYGGIIFLYYLHHYVCLRQSYRFKVYAGAEAYIDCYTLFNR